MERQIKLGESFDPDFFKFIDLREIATRGFRSGADDHIEVGIVEAVDACRDDIALKGPKGLLKIHPVITVVFSGPVIEYHRETSELLGGIL